MRRARATARHRDPNVHVNPLKKRETKSREGREREESRLCVYISRSIIWRLASSDTDRSGTFRFSGLYASSRAARPQGMRPIRREGLMHGYFHDRRSDTADAITVEEGRAGNESRKERTVRDGFSRSIGHVVCLIFGSARYFRVNVIYKILEVSKFVKYLVIEIVKLHGTVWIGNELVR